MTHPNLVKMLGYVTRPRLYIVQEFMAGSSLERQLYVERWRPTLRQALQVATVASVQVAQPVAHAVAEV